MPTTYKSATTLTAQVSADYLKNAGDPTVEVSSPAPGGGTSNGLTFTIHATTTPGATVISLLANDLAWDAVNQVIYLALPSVDGTNNGNSIQVLNPVDGTLGALSFAGSEPNLISVSANSKYLYVGLNGASNVQRMTLPNLVKDITIPMGSDTFNGPFFAMDVQAAPNADGTVEWCEKEPPSKSIRRRRSHHLRRRQSATQCAVRMDSIRLLRGRESLQFHSMER